MRVQSYLSDIFGPSLHIENKLKGYQNISGKQRPHDLYGR